MSNSLSSSIEEFLRQVDGEGRKTPLQPLPSLSHRFFDFEMKEYHITQTVQVCACGKKHLGNLSPIVYVYAEGESKLSGKTEVRKLPLEKVLRALEAYLNLEEGEGMQAMPRLATRILQADVSIPYCLDCFHSLNDNSHARKYNLEPPLLPRLPEVERVTFGTIESPNKDIAKEINALSQQEKRRNKSRRAKPKEERKKRAGGAAVTSLESLLNL